MFQLLCDPHAYIAWISRYIFSLSVVSVPIVVLLLGGPQANTLQFWVLLEAFLGITKYSGMCLWLHKTGNDSHYVMQIWTCTSCLTHAACAFSCGKFNFAGADQSRCWYPHMIIAIAVRVAMLCTEVFCFRRMTSPFLLAKFWGLSSHLQPIHIVHLRRTS